MWHFQAVLNTSNYTEEATPELTFDNSFYSVPAVIQKNEES